MKYIRRGLSSVALDMASRLRRLFSGAPATTSSITGTSPSTTSRAVSMERATTGSSASYQTDDEDSFNPIKAHPRYEKVHDIANSVLGTGFLVAFDKVLKKQVAIKFIERGHSVNIQIEREILVHRTLSGHPNVVQFTGVFLTPEHLGIVMDYEWTKDMEEYLSDKNGLLSENDARFLFQQLITGLAYYHQLGVSGRDIKLENTFVCTKQPQPALQLCDFGYSKNEQVNSDPLSNIQILAYTAPEAITHSTGYCTETADVWAAGVMLYIMLTGTYPFDSSEDRPASDRVQKMISKIHRVDYLPLKNASDMCKDFVSKILVADPNKRASVAQIVQHPWFLQNLDPKLLQVNSQIAGVTLDLPNPEDILMVVHEAQIPIRQTNRSLDDLTDEVYDEGLVESLMDEIALEDEDDEYLF